MKLKLKLHDITELAGGIIRLACEGPQGPHTIIHAVPEDCPEFIGLAKDDFGAEVEIEVSIIGPAFTEAEIKALMANRNPQPASATTPPAPPQAEIGTSPSGTGGEPTTGEPAGGSGVFLTRTGDLPAPSLIGPSPAAAGDVFGHTTTPLPRVQAPSSDDESLEAGIPDDTAPEAQAEEPAK